MKPAIEHRQRENIVGSLLVLCRIFIGAIFVLAGGAKLLEPASFVSTLVAYRVLPLDIVPQVAAVLPWLEVLIGSYLMAGFYSRAAAWAAMMMLLVFSVTIGQALFRGINLQDCGCFGSITEAVPALALVLGGKDAGAGDVVRDLIYIAIALPVAFAPRTPFSIDAWIARRRQAHDE